MVRYLIVIEKANGNYSAYCPDLPGCVATGKTHEETERNSLKEYPKSVTKDYLNQTQEILQWLKQHPNLNK